MLMTLCVNGCAKSASTIVLLVISAGDLLCYSNMDLYMSGILFYALVSSRWFESKCLCSRICIYSRFWFLWYRVVNQHHALTKSGYLRLLIRRICPSNHQCHHTIDWSPSILIFPILCRQRYMRHNLAWKQNTISPLILDKTDVTETNQWKDRPSPNFPYEGSQALRKAFLVWVCCRYQCRNSRFFCQHQPTLCSSPHVRPQDTAAINIINYSQIWHYVIRSGAWQCKERFLAQTATDMAKRQNL